MRRAIYPWLLCVYPIAYLYSENFDLVQGGQVPVTVAISLAVTTIVYLALRFATGRAHESALTTAIVVAVFFVGGHLAGLAQSPNAGFIQSSLLPVALAVAALIVFRVWWRVPTGDFGAFNLSLKAEIVSYDREQVVVHARSDRGGALVLTDAYAPGWTATVNGQPAPIWPANYLFRGVSLPPGEHRVVFRYAAPGYRAGRVAAMTALAVLGLVPLASRWRARASSR